MGFDLSQISDDLSIITGRKFTSEKCNQLETDNKNCVITKTKRVFSLYYDLLDHYDGEKLTSLPLSLKEPDLFAAERAACLWWVMYKLTALGKSKIFPAQGGEIFMGSEKTENPKQGEFRGIVLVPEENLSREKVRLISNAANLIKFRIKRRFDATQFTKLELTEKNIYRSWDEVYPQDHIDKLPELYDAWTKIRSELDYDRFFKR